MARTKQTFRKSVPHESTRGKGLTGLKFAPGSQACAAAMSQHQNSPLAPVQEADEGIEAEERENEHEQEKQREERLERSLAGGLEPPVSRKRKRDTADQTKLTQKRISREDMKEYFNRFMEDIQRGAEAGGRIHDARYRLLEANERLCGFLQAQVERLKWQVGTQKAEYEARIEELQRELADRDFRIDRFERAREAMNEVIDEDEG